MRQPVAMIAVLAVSAWLGGTGTAAAQSERGRVPDYGTVGVGVSFGAAIPNDESFSTGLTTSVEAERYVTPRLSVRALFGGNWNDIVNRGFSGTTTPIRLNGNVVYNWEGGQVHPFVTGGGGWYHYRFKEAQIEDSANKFGMNFGGGVEWFISRRDTVTGEVGYHFIPGDVSAPLTIYKPSFWTISAGYKKYF